MPTALVTGAAQGIGRRIAELFLSLGYDLVTADLRPCGFPGLDFPGDLSDAAQVGRMAEQAGSVDVLVNNAGISCIVPAEEQKLDDFRRVLEVNLVAPFLLCQLFGRGMLERRRGAIVNVASVAGLLAVSDRAAYNASKHGLVGLTRTLAAEWGGRGVRVNAVCPGWVKTEMDEADQAGGSYSDFDIEARVPMGRFASPDDIARAVAFLADPSQSGFVNGHCLSVDGGWSCDGSWDSLRARKRA